MTDAKEFLPRSFRIDTLVKTVALSTMLATAALVPTISNAQMAPAATPAVFNNTTETTTIIIPVVDATAYGATPGVDYRILANPHYNYADIARARARGLSDKDVARIISISEKANVPTSQIIDNIDDGWTFETIAATYGLPSNWRANSDTDELHNYLAAYRSTGQFALMADDNNSGVTSRTLAYNDTIVSTPGSSDVVHTLRSDPDFREFSRALRRTGLDATLEGAGPYTIFAPSNAAFDALPKDELKSLWNNKAELTQVIQYHILPTSVSAAQAMAMSSPTSPPTLEGDTLQVTSSNTQVMVNGNLVTKADIQASNGVIHEIDGVLIPSSIQSTWNGASTMAAPMPMTTPAPVATPAPTTNIPSAAPMTTITPPNSSTTNPVTTPNAALNPGVVTSGEGAAPVPSGAPMTPDNSQPMTTTPAAPIAPDTTTSTAPSATTPSVTATPDSNAGATTPSIGTSGTMNSPTTGTSSPATDGGNSGTVGATSTGTAGQ